MDPGNLTTKLKIEKEGEKYYTTQIKTYSNFIKIWYDKKLKIFVWVQITMKFELKWEFEFWIWKQRGKK